MIGCRSIFRAEVVDLAAAVAQEVLRVGRRPFPGRAEVVGRLLVERDVPARDPVVFESRVLADALGMNIGADIVRSRSKPMSR